MGMDCNSGRNRVGKNPASVHGIMSILAVFLFLGSPQVLLAASNTRDTAASDNFHADHMSLIEAEGCIEYTGNVVFPMGRSVITTDSIKAFFKQNADGGLPLNGGLTENIEDSFERIVAKGNARIVFEGLAATGDKAVYDPAVGSFILTGNPAAVASAGETIFPTEIKTDRIVFNEAEASAEFIGNVIFTQRETVITADNVITFFKKSETGGSSLKSESLETMEDSLERLVATGNVKIVMEDLVATGDKTVYDPAAGSFVLTGRPAALARGADTISSAEIKTDRIVFNEAEASAEFIGNVVMTQEKTVITADNAKTFLKESEDAGSSLKSESLEKINASFERLVAAGNVKIVSEDLVATGDKAVYDPTVGSFVLTGEPATFINSADTISSTEITAGRIVFNEAASSADFIGNATITQGENVIAADNVKAIFKSTKGGFSLNEDSPENFKDSFEKIVARGNVKIVVEDDVATGDEAVYDSAVGSFVLTGDKATLVKGVYTLSAPEIEMAGSL